MTYIFGYYDSLLSLFCIFPVTFCWSLIFLDKFLKNKGWTWFSLLYLLVVLSHALFAGAEISLYLLLTSNKKFVYEVARGTTLRWQMLFSPLFVSFNLRFRVDSLGHQERNLQWAERGKPKEGREEENMCSNKFNGPIRTKLKVIFLQFYKELTEDHPKNIYCVL